MINKQVCITKWIKGMCLGWLMLCFSFTTYAQLSLADKISIEFGGGIDYVGAGIKMNVQLTDNLDAFASIGTLIVDGRSPVLGFEYLRNRTVLKKLKPFVSLSLAKSFRVSRSIEISDSEDFFNTVSKSKVFYSANISSGLLLNFSKKNNKLSAKLGLTGQFINNNQLQTFIEDLNTRYSENFSPENKFFFISPMLALRLNLSAFAKE